MRGGWYLGIGAVGIAGQLGCVSLDDHNRLKASNRLVIADKETVEQDLFDERNVNDTFRSKVKSYEQEISAKDEMISVYRRENDLLQGLGKATEAGLSKLAGGVGAISIVGPKLPGPLDSALTRFAQEHPNEVEYDPARGSVKWKADLLFPLGSDVVKETSTASLKGFCDILKSPAAADFEVVVAGHTDNRPISRPDTKASHPTNWHLSSHRAIAVGNILNRFGYPSGRTGVMGCSEYRPISENNNDAGQAQNRRVEIYLVPAGSIVHTPTVASSTKPRSDQPKASPSVPPKPADTTAAKP